MSVLGLFNFLILQWFFIRLGKKINHKGKCTGFCIVKWVVPLTGWWSDYICIGKEWNF